jgi:serine/arginine repetitive matrix protein 1
MTGAGFFKGTSLEQDSRFSNKELKELKRMKFPPEFNEKVDLKKVKFEVIKPWISKRIGELLGFEDDVVINFVISYLEGESVDPRKLQLNLRGFLNRQAATFVSELWNLLLDAQKNEHGVPSIFVQDVKEQLKKRREETTRIQKGIEISQQRSENATVLQSQLRGHVDEQHIDKSDLPKSSSNDEKEQKQKEDAAAHKKYEASSKGDRTESVEKPHIPTDKNSHKERDRHRHHKDKDKDKDRTRDRDRDRDRHRDRERDRDRDSDRHKHKHKHKNEDRDKEKDRDRERNRDRDRDKDRDRDNHRKRDRSSGVTDTDAEYDTKRRKVENDSHPQQGSQYLLGDKEVPSSFSGADKEKSTQPNKDADNKRDKDKSRVDNEQKESLVQETKNDDRKEYHKTEGSRIEDLEIRLREEALKSLNKPNKSK